MKKEKKYNNTENSMNNTLMDVSEVQAKIKNNESLILAGDEKLFTSLPKGNWIGGTIPYFMTAEGGKQTKEKLFVTIIDKDMYDNVKIKSYNESAICSVYEEMLDNSFSFIIIPAMSQVHMSFALMSPRFPKFAQHPLVGWISGVHLNDLGKVSAKVFNGQTGETLTNQAIVMNITAKKFLTPDIGIINIFETSNTDQIEFLESSFCAKEAIINGEKRNFADYIQEKKLDIKFPLTTKYGGININISFQSVTNNEVKFYAPVFKNIKYTHSIISGNYIDLFIKKLNDQKSDGLVFSCNCILNYLYSELEGKKTGKMLGPITFGEVAYQLLNQTLVYLKLDKNE